MPHVLLALLILLLLTTSAHAQGYPPEEAARRMTLPAGVVAEPFAAEPMVRQPVAIEFDERGRLWVIQYLQYPNPAGLERVSVDRYSRTVYDRVPEPPPRGPQGADRITILADTDGDGRADCEKDFVAGLNLASGLAFGHGGVYVLQVPYLLYYADKNRDDVPDGDPQVLLTGFGMEDAHSVANSLLFGPDGWLYGAQGSTVTANIRGIEFQQGVWRYHPPTDRFELFYEGGGNTWGVDFDAEGNLFASTNLGGYIGVHGMQGAYYWKSFGKHGALHNPHAYGFFDHMPHENFVGGHVTVGGIVYQGNTLPWLRGKYVNGDLLGHAAYWNNLERAGSTFRSQHGGKLLLAGDTWFANSDVTSGPDGSIYLTDWHDARTAHPDPDAEWDRRNGRIYALRAKDAPRVPAFDLGELSSLELVDHLAHENNWYVRAARRLLAARQDKSVLSALLEKFRAADTAPQALEYAWTIQACGGLDESLLVELLVHGEPMVRYWGVRFIGDDHAKNAELTGKLAELAAREPDVRVRAQLACTARRLPLEASLPLLESLAAHAEDASDPFVPLLLWWALETQFSREPVIVVERFAQPAIWSSALARRELLPRLVRRCAAEGETGLLLATHLITSAPDDEVRLALFESLGDALAGPPLTRVPVALAEQIERLWNKDANRVRLATAAARLGYPPVFDWLRDQTLDVSAAEAARTNAIELLAALGAQQKVVHVLLAIALNDETGNVRLAATRGLARFDDGQVRDALIAQYSDFDPTQQAAAREVLFGRADWALAFLAGVTAGRLSAADVPTDELSRLALHQRADLDELVEKHWGRIGAAAPEERLADVRRLNNDLRAAAGDASNGRLLFREHCGKCHTLFGEGTKLGPDLTTANRQDRQYLLTSIVDPSTVVRKEYLGSIVATTDGRILTGLVAEETPVALTLIDGENRRHTIGRAEIDSVEPSTTSLMPERLLEKLTPQQLRDLFAYLQATEPP
ncbi:MAG: c-type cytochrome [Pirellulales bacterium]|nr:c-type cytochrome [Pirellulales bacterium]